MAFEWLTSAFSSASQKRPEDMTFSEARPAFFKAIKDENLGALTAFTKKFPDALGWEKDEGTALYIALHCKKLGSFKHLVSLGADMESAGHGNLVERAAKQGKKDFVQYMLEQGVSNIGSAEYYARNHRHFDIADMIKRKDIIRAEYLAQIPPASAAPAAVAATAEPAQVTDGKIDLLTPVQLKKGAPGASA